MDTALKSLPKVKGRKRRIWTRSQRKTADFYLFVSPWILGFLLLIVVPLIVAILASLTNYDGLSLNTIRWVGFSNYERALTNIDVDVKFSFTRTVMWGLLNLPTWLAISFGMALILNQNLKARGLFRTIYYIPSIVPLVAAMTAWKVMLDKNVGWLNGFLSLFWPGTAIGWLSEHALTGMTIVAVWTGLGTAMVIFLAGLQNIPDELVEAARIDGANGLQIFRFITLPLMTPVIFLQLIMGLIGVFQQLNLPLVLTQVGISRGAVPPRQIYLFMYHVYRQMFVSNRWGYGIALILIMFVVVSILTFIVFWTEKYWVYSDTQGEGD
ncbi:MAG: sugar ABC transporter permease [Chloroflexi bacterium]|nr:MAG: sugar ABC transporter permease [Chloroflexota bacterium]